MLLGDCAELTKETVHPRNIESGMAYLGLEHIGQETLHLSGVGSSADVTSTKQLFRSGDVLFGKLRPYFRKVVRPNFDGICSTDIWVLKAKNGVNQRFLFYWVASWDFVNYVNSASEGTRMPRAKWDVAESHEISTFTLLEQKAIVHILGTLDDKIELNRQINETLEAMAQAIFKDWFVDFGPVRRKQSGETDPVKILGGLIPDSGRAASIVALFPDSFNDDGLPEGWEVSPLDEMGIFRNGLALQKYPPSKVSEQLPVVKIAQLRKGSTKGDDLFASDVPEKFVIDDGDFIFSWSGSLMAKYWVGGRAALNQHLFKVEEKTQPLWFVAGWVERFTPEFKSIAASKATTMGHIKREHLKQALCVVPPVDLVSACSKIILPIIEGEITCQQETKMLAETRDYLLPKLMSGEVRVADVDEVA